jgi:hypothetical protein
VLTVVWWIGLIRQAVLTPGHKPLAGDPLGWKTLPDKAF